MVKRLRKSAFFVFFSGLAFWYMVMFLFLEMGDGFMKLRIQVRWLTGKFLVKMNTSISFGHGSKTGYPKPVGKGTHQHHSWTETEAPGPWPIGQPCSLGKFCKFVSYPCWSCGGFSKRLWRHKTPQDMMRERENQSNKPQNKVKAKTKTNKIENQNKTKETKTKQTPNQNKKSNKKVKLRRKSTFSPSDSHQAEKKAARRKLLEERLEDVLGSFEKNP